MIRQWLTNSLLIGMAIAFLYHVMLLFKWQLLIQEPNKWILSAEVALFVGCIILGLYNMVSLFKEDDMKCQTRIWKCSNCGKRIRGSWKLIGARYYHPRCQTFAKRIYPLIT